MADTYLIAYKSMRWVLDTSENWMNSMELSVDDRYNNIVGVSSSIVLITLKS